MHFISSIFAVFPLTLPFLECGSWLLFALVKGYLGGHRFAWDLGALSM
jgi:hypothetical protein